MKILQIIYESLGNPFGFGGAGVRAYEIYKRLRQRHEITLLCMRYPGAKDGELEGLNHIFVGTESRSLSRSVLSYTIKAAEFVRNYGDNFDIIVENFLPSTPFFSRFLTKTTVILQIQGIMERHALKKFNMLFGLPMYLVEKFYPYLYDNYLFVSETTMKKMMSRIKDSSFKKCYLIPNGIDADYLDYDSTEGDYILFLSRIDIYTKGLDILVKAFERISPEFPEIRLVLAGYEFDPVERLLSLCPEGLRRRIEYAGFLTGDEKLRLISGAKVFVLPSRHESSPISILEAAACGRPVIVSDIPELSFVTKNNFGLSFRTGSVEGLVEKLRILTNDKDKRLAMGRRGRDYARLYLWDYIVLKFENVLKDLYEKKRD